MKKYFKLILNIVLGGIPSILFFIWIERNCSLPNFVNSHSNPLSWPWIQLDLSTAEQTGWNFSIFLIFGAIHTYTAQASFQRILERFFASDFHRSVFMILTGVSVTILMALWQNTGVILWLVPGLSFFTLNLFSLGLYLFFTALAMSVLLKFDGLSFVGIRQLIKEPAILESPPLQRLHRDGFFRYVRHPIYFFTLLATLITPFMTLDRLTLFAAAAVYLKLFGLHYEERKLVAIFGKSYQDFQREVPAIFPNPTSQAR